MPPAPKFAHDAQVDLILDAAAKCIGGSSLLDFTMSAISREAGLSMGSIYKHVQSKEDVLVALGQRCASHFGELAKDILSLPLPLVTRIVAVQLIDPGHNYPYAFGAQLITLLGNEAILKRASPGWLDRYIASETAVESLFRQQLLDACARGELDTEGVPPEVLAEEINTCVWAICVGCTQVQMQRNMRSLTHGSSRLDSDSTVVRGLQRLLNSYRWRTPLDDASIEQACRLLNERGLR